MTISLKKISLILTLLVHILIVGVFKLLDSFSLIFSIYFTFLIIGFLLKFYSKNKFKEIGWGLFYASITSIIFVGSFLIWLDSNYPK